MRSNHRVEKAAAERASHPKVGRHTGIRCHCMSSDAREMRVFCQACRLQLADVGEPRPVGSCPRCGDSGTASFPPGQEFVLTGNLSINSRPKDGGRWGCKSSLINSLFNKTGDLHFITRIIDRWSNRYQERIIEVGTGRVVREVDEPLTEHRRRGSARKKPRSHDD